MTTSPSMVPPMDYFPDGTKTADTFSNRSVSRRYDHLVLWFCEVKTGYSCVLVRYACNVVETCETLFARRKRSTHLLGINSASMEAL